MRDRGRFIVLNPENRPFAKSEFMAMTLAGVAGYDGVAQMSVKQMIEYSGGTVSPLAALDYIRTAREFAKRNKTSKVEIPKV